MKLGKNVFVDRKRENSIFEQMQQICMLDLQWNMNLYISKNNFRHNSAIMTFKNTL